jgi:hypothetical protein
VQHLGHTPFGAHWRTAPAASPQGVHRIGGRVLDQLSETYPQFAELLHADAIGRAA